MNILVILLVIVGVVIAVATGSPISALASEQYYVMYKVPQDPLPMRAFLLWSEIVQWSRESRAAIVIKD